MYHKKSEKGQALVIIALAAVGLFAFSALAIDGSRVFSDRRHAQNAADTAVLAAALAKIRTPDYPPNPPGAPEIAAVDAAIERARTNGYENDADSIVEVHFCDEVGLRPPCEGLPASADTLEEKSEYIQVVIKLDTQTTFARILGWQRVPSIVTAVARAKMGSNEPFVNGRALAAMSQDASPAIAGNGNFSLTIENSGLFDNSRDGCAFVTDGSAGVYSVETTFDVVGGYCPAGVPTLSGTLNEGVAQLPYPPAINIPPPSPPITCTLPSVYDAVTKTFSPGNHVNRSIPNGTVNFAAGDHCFTGGLSVSGNSAINATDARFLFTSGDFRITSGDLTCTNLLVHTTGTSSGIHFSANNTTNNCTGVTFYIEAGDVDLSGNGTNIFTAPTTGTYAGLLIHLPYGNGNTVSVSGNSFSQFTGSIIAVDSHIQIVGNSDTLALSTQIIGETVALSGNGEIVIDYNPDQQYAVGDPTSISLTE